VLRTYIYAQEAGFSQVAKKIKSFAKLFEEYFNIFAKKNKDDNLTVGDALTVWHNLLNKLRSNVHQEP
jgi:hypothetical protein